MILVLVAGLGLLLGSFVNAMVWRVREQSLRAGQRSAPGASKRHLRLRAKDLSVLTGRSMCPNCHHLLGVNDLVPVVSWVALGGKCRYCRRPISWQYPIVELLAATLFAISYVWWPMAWTPPGIVLFIFWLLFLTGFIALAVYDLFWFLLPDRIVLPLIILAVLEVLVRGTILGGGWQPIGSAGLGVLFLAGLFFGLFEVSKGAWLGFGDVKLAVVLGLLVGGPWNAILLIFIASLLGTVVAIPLLWKRQLRVTSKLPFGPFLLVAAYIVVLFGATITNWYQALFAVH